MKYPEIYVELLRRNQKLRNDIVSLRYTRPKFTMQPEEIVPENLDMYGNTEVHWLELIDAEVDKYIALDEDFRKLSAESKNTDRIRTGIQLVFRDISGLQDLEFDNA